MYKPEVKNPIHLISTEEMDIVTTFKNFDSLTESWDWLKNLYHNTHELGPTLKKEWRSRDDYVIEDYRYFRRYGKHLDTKYRYVLRDSFGDYVDPEDVEDRYYDLHPNKRYRPFWMNYVPGAKRSYGRYYRHIRTTQERKWSFSWYEEEDEPKPRASRNFHNLPNGWDDIPFSHGYRSKNWKKYRKTQYK